MNLRWLPVLLVTVGVMAEVRADALWAKDHVVVDWADGARLAEFTLIQRVDAEGQGRWRLLFADANGRRVVVRGGLDPEGQLPLRTFTDPSSGVEMKLGYAFADGRRQLVIAVGSDTLAVPADERITPPNRVRLDAVFAKVPESLQGALEGFVRAGASGVAQLAADARMVRRLFFPRLKVLGDESTRTTPESLMPFEAAATEPNAFEQSFGGAYRE